MRLVLSLFIPLIASCPSSPSGPSPELVSRATILCEASYFAVDDTATKNRSICTTGHMPPMTDDILRNRGSCTPGSAGLEHTLALLSDSTGFSIANFDDCVAKANALKKKLGQAALGPEVAKSVAELVANGSCAKMFSSKLGAGEICQAPTECKAGLACTFDDTTQQKKTCKPRIAPLKTPISKASPDELKNAACDHHGAHRACQENDVCAESATGSYCVSQGTAIADGQECGNQSKGLSELCQNPCSRCIFEDTLKKCKPFGVEGADCFVHADCGADFYCDDDSDKCNKRKTSGECSVDGNNKCADGYWCKEHGGDSNCVAQIKEGACDSDDYNYLQCAAGLCVDSNCSPVTLGAPCNPNDVCFGTDLICSLQADLKSGKCAASPGVADGESCVEAYLMTLPKAQSDNERERLKDPGELVGFLQTIMAERMCRSNSCNEKGICEPIFFSNNYSPGEIAKVLVYGTLTKP